ncbi:hypothetical protein DH2020_036835 [Rehmannia glutinosa]|uniref:Endopeptidase S2P n=1 Tax=Rehmannia glutinosa TaxID=99300 RepID=A0ABR0V5T2_REHGL
MIDSRRGRRRWSDQTLLPLRPPRQHFSTVSCWYCDFKFLAFNEPLFRFGRRNSRLLFVKLSEHHLCMWEITPCLTIVQIAGLNISLPSTGYVCISSVICIIVHEFGHALAAASALHLLPNIGRIDVFISKKAESQKRIGRNNANDVGIMQLSYASKALTETLAALPQVLDVPTMSPLSGYLSPHDVIFSLDDFHIHTAEEWKQVIALLTKQTHMRSSGPYGGIVNVEKGYCVPRSLIEESTNLQFEGIEQFVQVESCLTPVQLPGLGWVEITYSSLQCHNHGGSLFSDKKHSSSGESSCIQTFVFIGDLISMAHSIHLTSYQPRWSIYFAAYLPNLLEKLLTCAFHVSLVLALLNSLPVYFLDGESILEVTLNYFSSLSSRMKQLILRYLVVGLVPGTAFKDLDSSSSIGTCLC